MGPPVPPSPHFLNLISRGATHLTLFLIHLHSATGQPLLPPHHKHQPCISHGGPIKPGPLSQITSNAPLFSITRGQVVKGIFLYRPGCPMVPIPVALGLPLLPTPRNAAGCQLLTGLPFPQCLLQPVGPHVLSMLLTLLWLVGVDPTCFLATGHGFCLSPSEQQ